MQEHDITPEQQVMFLTISTEGKRTIIPYIAEMVWKFRYSFTNRNHHSEMLVRQRISKSASSVYAEKYLQKIPLDEYGFIFEYLSDFAKFQGEIEEEKKVTAQTRMCEAYEVQDEHNRYLLTTATKVLTNVVYNFAPPPTQSLHRS